MKIKILGEGISLSRLKNLCILILITLSFVSCYATALAKFRDANRQSLLRLRIGMTKAEVLRTMGARRVSTPITRISNPYRSEILQGKEKTFEVLYYYTDVKRRDDAITDDELTPLIFDEERLIGWGWSFLKETVIKYEIRIR